MKKGLRFTAAILSAAALISCTSVTAFADKVKNINGYYYRYSDGGISKGLMSGWGRRSDGSRCYYQRGKILTSQWIKENGKRAYYVNANGTAVTGEVLVDGKRYFFDNNGRLIKEIQQINVPTVEETVRSDSYLSASVTELTTEYITLLFKKQGDMFDYDYTVSPVFSIEKKVNGVWSEYDKKFYNSRSWDDRLIYIDESYNYTASSTFSFCRAMPVGKYRIVSNINEKIYDDSIIKKKLYTEFEITKTTPNKLGISISTSNITKKGMNIIISQYNGTANGEITYGEDYYLEKKNSSGEWKSVKTKTNAPYSTVAVVLGKNGSKNIKLNWEKLYGSLSKGEYRIVKKFSCCTRPGAYEDVNAYGYFTIK